MFSHSANLFFHTLIELLKFFIFQWTSSSLDWNLVQTVAGSMHSDGPICLGSVFWWDVDNSWRTSIVLHTILILSLVVLWFPALECIYSLFVYPAAGLGDCQRASFNSLSLGFFLTILFVLVFKGYRKNWRGEAKIAKWKKIPRTWFYKDSVLFDRSSLSARF